MEISKSVKVYVWLESSVSYLIMLGNDIASNIWTDLKCQEVINVFIFEYTSFAKCTSAPSGIKIIQSLFYLNYFFNIA